MAKASEQDPSRPKPFNPFNFDRGKCRLCDRCEQFHGNFSLDCQFGADVFECTECRCPMNSHPIIVSDRTFSELLYSYLLNRDLKESHLNTQTFVAVFVQSKPENPQQTHNKKLRQLLNEGGYSVLSSQTLENWQFRHKLVEQRLFDRVDRCIDKYSFDEYFNFFKAMGRLPVDPMSMDFREEAESIKEKINLYLRLRDQLRIAGLKKGVRVECLLLRGDEHANPAHFLKFARAIAEQLQPHSLLYSSPNLYSACVDTQLFFPSYMRINYETVLLPNQGSQSMTAASDKLRDVLDFNNFVVVEDGFQQIRRTKLQNAFIFNRSPFLLNYLLGQQVVSEVVPQFVMKIVAKIGPPHLNNPCRQLGNVIRVRDPMQNQQLQKELCPELLCSQRCALVLRPALVKSGMDELILNYFRLNDFTLVSRVFVQLNEQQAEFFALLENIRSEERKEYLEMMSGGLLEVVLVSKRAAIVEANILNEGARYGLRQNSARLIKEPPSLSVTINGKTYKEEVTLGYRNSLLSCNIGQVFNGVHTLFDLQNIILRETREEAPIVVDSATGELIREQHTSKPSHQRIGPRVTQAILEELNCDTFNYWMYTSTSETITEEIVSQFMPECQLFEWVCVLVKPGYTHLSKLIRSHLELLKYKVIAIKTVLLSKALAANLINSLLVLRLDPEIRQSLSSKYCNEKVEVICLAKPGGRRQMLSYLTGFTLGDPTSTINVNEPLNDVKLKQLLVPVWTAEPLVLQILSPALHSLEDSIRNLATLAPQEQFTVLNFLCGAMLGVAVDSLPLKTSIGELSHYLLDSEEDAKLQSWYYATVSAKHPHLVPLIFQYRKYDDLVFCLQSHNGQEFIQHVLDGYFKQNLNPDERKKRHSLVLYLWAKRLAQLAAGLSKFRSELTGWGEIGRHANIYRGAISDEGFVPGELKRISRLMAHPDLAAHKDVVKTLKRVAALRGFLDRGKKDNRRLLPMLQEDSLRVIKTSQLTKLHMLDQFELIDPNHELSDPLNMSVIGLYNIKPCLLPRYALFSKIYVDLLKYSSLSKDYGKPLSELLDLFVQLIEKTPTTDFEMIGVEIYLMLVDMYAAGEKWALPFILEGVPMLSGKLGKLNEAVDTTEGKKRKFIEKKQYFTDKVEPEKPARLADPADDKYIVNVYAGKTLPQKNALFNPTDPQHSKWASEVRMVNLVREVDNQNEPRRGINVEYEKKISENEQLVRAQVNKQVDKYVDYNEEEFLYETGLERRVWYRRVKGEEKREGRESQPKPKPQLEKALDKQVQMFLSFKHKQDVQPSHQ